MDSRKAIIDSAFELFEQRSFKRISVREIIGHAGCSRGTFYKYFDSKHELMHLYFRARMDSILEAYDGRNYESIAAQAFRFALEHDSYLRNVKDTEGTESFWGFLYRYTLDLFSAVRHENNDRSPLSEEQLAQLAFITNGVVGIFREYVDGNVMNK